MQPSVQRTENQPSRILCSAYGVLVGERMRLYAGCGLVAVMVTGKNIHNAVVDIQVGQTRLIIPLPLSPSRYPLVQTTFFSLFLLLQKLLTMIPQSSSPSLHIPVLFTPAFSPRTTCSYIQLHVPHQQTVHLVSGFQGFFVFSEFPETSKPLNS